MKVLMVCSGGMSSAIVVKAIKAEADKKGFVLEIKAVGTGEFEDELQIGNYDMVLVAPQVKHRLGTFQEQAKPYGIPVDVVVPMGYTPLGGSKILEQIIKHSK